MPRVIDLSQAVAAWPGPAPYYPPPHYSHHEELDAEFHRAALMGLVDISRVQLGSAARTASEVTMSVDPMGSHAEVYWLDDRVMFGTLPAEKRVNIKDMAQWPVQRMVGPAAVVNLTDFGPGSEVDIPDLESRASHVRRDDIVLLRTGYSERIAREGLKFSQANYSGSPGLSPRAGQWLADKGIKALAMDSRSPEVEAKVWKDPNREISFPVHRTMHDAGVVLIEDITNLTRIRSPRVWAACGVAVKASGLSGGSASMLVVDGEEVIDVTNPTGSYPGEAPAPGSAVRPEDWRRRGDVFRRLRIRKITFKGLNYGYPRNMPDWAEFISFSSRLGTHIVTPPAYGPAELPLAMRFGRASVLRLRDVGPQMAIGAASLRAAAEGVQPGDALILRTDYADWNAPLEFLSRPQPVARR